MDNLALHMSSPWRRAVSAFERIPSQFEGRLKQLFGCMLFVAVLIFLSKFCRIDSYKLWIRKMLPSPKPTETTCSSDWPYKSHVPPGEEKCVTQLISALFSFKQGLL